MLNELISRHIDPRKLVERSAMLDGMYALADMSRLCERLAGDAGQVYVKVSFGRDRQKLAIMHSVLDVEVSMVCQRCLETATFSVHGEYTYAILKKDQCADGLPKGYDVLEVGEEPLDLLALVEDELLLSLPIVPAHDSEVCQYLPGFVTEDKLGASEVKDKCPNPFSLLVQLKRDPNV